VCKVAVMYRVLALFVLVGVATASVLPRENQKQQTAVENAARTLTAGALANPVAGIWQVITKTLLILAIIWLSYLTIDQIFISNRRSFARSLTTGWDYEEGMLKHVLNSIDPVDMSFRFMQIDNSACRKRTLCELSAYPLIGKLMRSISPSVSSLEEYQDAMSAGEALQDCALLFAECPENLHLARK